MFACKYLSVAGAVAAGETKVMEDIGGLCSPYTLTKSNYIMHSLTDNDQKFSMKKRTV